jgi:glycosyltransferase involved in cell wall biosynthesis
MTDRARVSVMLITYNHVKFIAQSIQSVLDQEVDFKVEINVIDDCSTDGTQNIVRDFARRYPEIVRPYINKKNIGYKVTQRNFFRGFQTLKGDYIAILEGDDYWTVPDKLRKQVEFLERHPHYVACAHNVMKVYESGEKEPHLFLPPPNKEDHDIFDLIRLSSYFHTTSLTYRNVFKGVPPKGFRDKLSCDIFITIAHAQYGKIRFFNDVMSVYRYHSSGRFSNMSETRGWMFNIDGYRRYNAWLGYRYNHAFSSAIYLYCEYLLRHGKEADGLTWQRRLKYKLLGKFYKALHHRFQVPSLGQGSPS